MLISPITPFFEDGILEFLKKNYMFILFSVVLSVQSYSVFQIVFLSQEIVYFGNHFISRECKREMCAD